MTDKEWSAHTIQNGRLRCVSDAMDGDYSNPFKKGSGEWLGYEQEYGLRMAVERKLENDAGRLGV